MVDMTVRGQCEFALTLAREGEYSQALDVCKRILAAYPKHVATYSVMAQVCLAMGHHEQAADLFRRVLGADPEHALSYAGLGVIYEERGLLDEAIWQFERALELSPGNSEIRSELRRLYSRRELAQPRRVHMSRAGLARAYLRGQLYPRAIGELTDLLADEPARYDLQVALAEAYWRDEQQERATALCVRVLAALPSCLKANLLLGQMGLQTERDAQAREHLQLAQELDPENLTAQMLFAERSPLPTRSLRLAGPEGDVSEPELPYLRDDSDLPADSDVALTPATTEELVQDRATIPVPEAARPSDTATPGLQGLRATRPPSALSAEVIHDLASDAGAKVRTETIPPAAPSASQFESGRSPEGTTPEHEAGGPPEGLSLIDVQYQYVRDHPDDYQARLDLARWLRDMGNIDEAAFQYNHLLGHHQEALPELVRDLELLNRFYPHIPALEQLVQEARDRDRRGPPAK